MKENTKIIVVLVIITITNFLISMHTRKPKIITKTEQVKVYEPPGDFATLCENTFNRRIADEVAKERERLLAWEEGYKAGRRK